MRTAGWLLEEPRNRLGFSSRSQVAAGLSKKGWWRWGTGQGEGTDTEPPPFRWACGGVSLEAEGAWLKSYVYALIRWAVEE